MAKKPEEAVLDAKGTTAVATKSSAALATKEEVFAQIAGDQNFVKKFESDELAIPFVRILQSLSPQIKKADPRRIDGAEEGDWYNTVSHEVIKGPLTIIPVHYERRLIEWKLREDGGGFVKDMPYNADVLKATKRDEKNRDRIVNGDGSLGTHLATTALYPVLVLREDGRAEEMVVALTSTALKVARQLNAIISARKVQNPATGQYVTPPMFFGVYTLTPVPMTNEKGSWTSLKVEAAGDILTVPNGMALYLAARDLAEQIQRGERTIQTSALDEAEEVEAEVSEEAPF